MRKAAAAGALYFACVFAAGFVLGVVRVLVLAPALGALAATLIELPIILGIAWSVSSWLTRRFVVPRERRSRLAMGGIAFALLMVAEAALSVAVFGDSLATHLERYRALPKAAGLVGQIAFALLPLLQLARARP